MAITLYNQDKIRFGKYKGTLIAHIPEDYKRWLIQAKGYNIEDIVLLKPQLDVSVKKTAKGVWLRIRKAKILVSESEALLLSDMIEQLQLNEEKEIPAPTLEEN